MSCLLKNCHTRQHVLSPPMLHCQLTVTPTVPECNEQRGLTHQSVAPAAVHGYGKLHAYRGKRKEKVDIKLLTLSFIQQGLRVNMH